MDQRDSVAKVAGLLFDVSPEDDAPKKKSKKKKPAEAVAVVREARPADLLPKAIEFVATAVDEARCPACGCCGDIDVAERGMWRVICGWSCGLAWWQPAVAGVLERIESLKMDDLRKADPGHHVVRSGRFCNKTLRELWQSEHRWYVEWAATNATSEFDRSAARDFLSRVG